MINRRPQINFQVDEAMKTLYEQAKLSGHWVTRLCSAGLLLMIEDAQVRARAVNRLCEWEAEYGDASARPESSAGAKSGKTRPRRMSWRARRSSIQGLC
jgi:hypothetical protein